MSDNQFKLLGTKRFLPLFITQFLEAFNDNFLKSALLILITYTLAHSARSVELLTMLAAAFLIAPFFLFSATAGQLADRFDKAILTRIIKLVEVAAMTLAAIGFIHGNVTLLFTALFLMGTHSAFFGPIKFAILPDHLKQEELIAGNALIESSTFLAILVGTIAGGVVIAIDSGVHWAGFLGLVFACLGLLSSFFIPAAPGPQPQLRINKNFIDETFNIIKVARENRRVFLAILAISWFWLVGTVFLFQLPNFCKVYLHANQSVVTFFLGAFSIGIGIGALICERLQDGEISARFVPAAIIAMSLAIFDLAHASTLAYHTEAGTLLNLSQFLTSFNHWRISVDIFMIAVAGGIYSVPLYTIMQAFSKKAKRSRIIAANNIINALFMVAGTTLTSILLIFKFTIPHVFMLIGVLNAAVAIYVCKLLPDAIVKSFVRWLLKICFKVKLEGLDNYRSASKRAIIVANHVSFLDGLLLIAFLPDRPMFAINTFIAKQWWIKPFINLFDAFVIDPTNPMSTKSLIREIQKNKRCIIFPEGRLTMTGALMKIYEGPATIADKTHADILPIRIDGAQYSPFSRLKGKVRIRRFPKITLTVLPPRRFELDKAVRGRERRRQLSTKLYELMTDLMFESSPYQQTITQALLDAAKIHGRKHAIIEDINRKTISYTTLVKKTFVLAEHIQKESQDKQIIGLLLPNMAASAVTFFAVLFSGRIAAMLNYSTGVNNLCSAIETAKINWVITSKTFIKMAKLDEHCKAMTDAGCRITYLEDLAETITWPEKLTGLWKSFLSRWHTPAALRTQRANDPAVVLFTSGSEGKPKAVLLSHENIQANRYQLSARVDFNASDIIFNALPIFHSFGLTAGLLLPIMTGIRVFLYPSPLHYRIVPEMVYDTNATILFGTDTFLRGYARCANPYDFYSVRYVFAGAEQLQAATRNAWNEKFGIRIFEGYGATETSPALCTNTPMYYAANSVGKFLPKIEYRLEKIEGIERGGRLFVSGPNIMLGYYRNEKPGVLQAPENNWYDTGDIVYVDELGYVFIEGRAKRFAKIAGEMVSLTAVEIAIKECWPEAEHAVIAVADAKKGEQLFALTTQEDARRDQLHQFFKQAGIGEIYLPKKIMYVKELPLLGTGKVDYVQVKAFIE